MPKCCCCEELYENDTAREIWFPEYNDRNICNECLKEILDDQVVRLDKAINELKEKMVLEKLTKNDDAS